MWTRPCPPQPCAFQSQLAQCLSLDPLPRASQHQLLLSFTSIQEALPDPSTWMCAGQADLPLSVTSSAPCWLFNVCVPPLAGKLHRIKDFVITVPQDKPGVLISGWHVVHIQQTLVDEQTQQDPKHRQGGNDQKQRHWKEFSGAARRARTAIWIGKVLIIWGSFPSLLNSGLPMAWAILEAT